MFVLLRSGTAHCVQGGGVAAYSEAVAVFKLELLFQGASLTVGPTRHPERIKRTKRQAAKKLGWS
jgi:hypothetical protein